MARFASVGVEALDPCSCFFSSGAVVSSVFFFGIMFFSYLFEYVCLRNLNKVVIIQTRIRFLSYIFLLYVMLLLVVHSFLNKILNNAFSCRSIIFTAIEV